MWVARIRKFNWTECVVPTTATIILPTVSSEHTAKLSSRPDSGMALYLLYCESIVRRMCYTFKVHFLPFRNRIQMLRGYKQPFIIMPLLAVTAAEVDEE